MNKINEKRKGVYYDLGKMIGELIVCKYLPSLDIYEPYNVTTVIKVSEEESKKHKQLHNDWFKKYDDFKCEKSEYNPIEEWTNLQEFEFAMEEKYLPHVLKCRVPHFNCPEYDLPFLKQGIRDSLWDCDFCCYKILSDDDIIIEEDYVDKFKIEYDRFITLNLDMDKKIQY